VPGHTDDMVADNWAQLLTQRGNVHPHGVGIVVTGRVVAPDRLQQVRYAEQAPLFGYQGHQQVEFLAGQGDGPPGQGHAAARRVHREVPEAKDGDATGLTLLHLQMRDRLPAATIRGVMQGYRRRYQSLLAEWTTCTSMVTDVSGAINFRGYLGSYDVTLATNGVPPALCRFDLVSGAGTNEVTMVFHSSGARPLLHGAAWDGTNGFSFNLASDAGHTYDVQVSTNLMTTNWSTTTNIINQDGTLRITNGSSILSPQQFFRARLRQ